MRLSEPAFACLEIAKKMEGPLSARFPPQPPPCKRKAILPQWTLLPEELSIQCESGRLQFDLGAIGKGFALDRMAELLRQLGLSGVLAGCRRQQHSGRRSCRRKPPAGLAAWAMMMRRKRLFLATCVLEWLGARGEGKPHSRSAHRPARHCGKTVPGPWPIPRLNRMRSRRHAWF
jgi:hypothetical protein